MFKQYTNWYINKYSIQIGREYKIPFRVGAPPHHSSIFFIENFFRSRNQHSASSDELKLTRLAFNFRCLQQRSRCSAYFNVIYLQL